MKNANKDSNSDGRFSRVNLLQHNNDLVGILPEDTNTLGRLFRNTYQGAGAKTSA